MLKGKRAARWLAAFLIAWGLLWLLGALALPPLLKWQLQQRGSEFLGRELRIAAIRFTPWNLRLSVEGIELAGAASAPGQDAAPPQLQVERLMLDLDARSLWHRAPVISALEFTAPRVRVTHRADGSTDLNDLRARLSAQPQPETADKDAPPPRFALHNLRLERGELLFEDQARGVRHELRELQLALPFISSLPADVDTQVQPRLAFVLDGSRFESGASATPFSRHRDSTLDLRLDALQLAPLSAYLPAGLKLRQGQLDTQLQLRFRLADDGTPQLDVQGRVQAQDLALADPHGEPLLGWKSLQVAIEPSQPLRRLVALGPVSLDGLELHAGRDAQGRPLPALGGSEAAKPASAPASAKQGTQAASGAADGVPAEAAWKVSVQSLDVKGAALHWRDEALKLRWRVEALDAQARALQWPLQAAVPFEASARLRPEEGAAAAPAASFKVSGEAAAEGGTLGFELRALPLRPLAPLLAQALRPLPEGQLGVQGQLRWTPAGLQSVELAQARLDKLRLLDAATPSAPPLAAWDALALEGVRVTPASQAVEIGRLRLQSPALQLARDAQGRINAASWFQPAADAPAAATSAATSTPARDAAAAPAWRVRLGQFQLDDGRVRWRDAQPQPQAPVDLDVSKLQLSLQDLQWPLAGGARRASLALQLIDPEDKTPGRVQWNGQVQLTPLALDGRWRIERLPLHLLQAYAGDALPLHLLHGEAGFDGELSLALGTDGPRAQARGDILLGGVHVVASREQAAGDELLSWQSFALKGFDATVRPGSKPRVALQSATLSDFYARLVVTEQGRFNLQDLRGQPVLDTAAAAPAPDAAASAATAAASAPAAARDGVAVGEPLPSRTRELPLDLVLGSTTLLNGRIDFNDRFIRPNYSAELTELNGMLGPLRSDSPALAPLSLRGRAAGSAVLDIQGTVNPLSDPPELNVEARATGLELPPLSPYAGKYAGYAIERGKLSVDVNYRIDNEGRLQARNRLTLNQLTFGERVESPTATKLPVLLAVSLLQDRHGNIDLDLPISGSLNDPQFSVGGIILRLIGNLLLKALTSPFSLLAGAHGPDLSRVGFDPGSALPAPAGREVLEHAAKALQDKPALQTTITGEADAQAEGEAIRRARLEARIRAEQRKQALRAGTAAQAELPPPTPAQREALLRRVYADTPLPDKPRNLIGLARELPPAEMEQRLLAAIAVTEESARELAVQRALAVRDALIAQGVPGERLFVAAPRLHAAKPAPEGEQAPAWAPQAELSLR